MPKTALPPQFVITLHDKQLTVDTEFEEKEEMSLRGLSPKGVYKCKETEARIFVKYPKQRDLTKDIFRNAKSKDELNKITELSKRIELLQKELSLHTRSEVDAAMKFLNTQRRDGEFKLSQLQEKVKCFLDVKSQLKPYEDHKQDLLLMHAFNAVFAPILIDKLMQDLFVVPKNFLRISPETGDPLIFSCEINGFDECFSKSEQLAGITCPADHEKRARRIKLDELVKELKLTPAHLEALGVTLMVVLLTNHGDVINNIDLSNFGFVQTKGKVTGALADFEPVFNGGFKNLSADDCAAMNEDFLTGEINFDDVCVSGFQFCAPFDEASVFALLPRQVSDIFEIKGEELLDAPRIAGFQKAIEQVELYVREKGFDFIVSESIAEALQHMSPQDAKKIQERVINQNRKFYLAESTSGAYTLASVLKGRLNYLKNVLLKQFLEGKTSKEITLQTFKSVIAVNLFRPSREAPCSSQVSMDGSVVKAKL